MGLFNLFNKKQANSNPMPGKSDSRDFISDLVSYFNNKPDVDQAYLGLVPIEGQDEPVLFLAVSHSGDDHAIQQVTWMTKSAYLPDIEMKYASTRMHKEVFGFVKDNNFPIYSAANDERLHQSIVRQWLEPEKFTDAFSEEIKRSDVAALAQKPDREDNKIIFQSYVRDGKEFMPLFSSNDMMAKCGMAEIPEGLEAIGFNFKTMNEMLNNGFDGKFFVLNPGTAFEMAFYG